MRSANCDDDTGLANLETSGAMNDTEVGYGELFMRLLAEALAHVDHTGERHFEAEVYRIKGELLLQQAIPDTPQAEAYFQQALAVAQSQQTKSRCENRRGDQ